MAASAGDNLDSLGLLHIRKKFFWKRSSCDNEDNWFGRADAKRLAGSKARTPQVEESWEQHRSQWNPPRSRGCKKKVGC